MHRNRNKTQDQPLHFAPTPTPPTMSEDSFIEVKDEVVLQAAESVGVSNSDFAPRKNTLNRLINDLRLTGQSPALMLDKILC